MSTIVHQKSTGATYHGANIGHGYVKYFVSTPDGERSTIFPALVAPAPEDTDSLRHIPTVEVVTQGEDKRPIRSSFWVGEDALLSAAPISLRSHQRLYNLHVIPALVKSALARLEHPDGGACVSGLPASWSTNQDLAKALGSRLREGAGPGYYHGQTLKTGLRVISEPLGAIYGVLLDEAGQTVGDPIFTTGRIGVIDLGHNTVDLCIVQALTVQTESLYSAELGSVTPLQQLSTQLSGYYNIDLQPYEVDQAVRRREVKVAGQWRDLPEGWDKPWISNGKAVVEMVSRYWGSAARLDKIVVAGGGAEVKQLVEALESRFKHQMMIAADPQLAIARGYARRALRYEVTGQ